MAVSGAALSDNKVVVIAQPIEVWALNETDVTSA
jgi:hypothetical protein